MKNTIELYPVKIDNDYRKKFNIIEDDYCHLFKNGTRVSNVLYRKGGMSTVQDLQNDYFMILKHVEAKYPDEITKDKKRKLHLASHWVILDNNCNEKVVFEHYVSPYLTGGIIYSSENKYYNIETGECYGYGYKSLTSKNFIFIDNIVNKTVKKININDGSVEVFE